MVGKDALMIEDKSKPTMGLNLEGYSKEHPQYLVVHLFGHVLGLENEHQRPDFWDVASKFIDEDKMRGDLVGRGGKSFNTDWFRKSINTDWFRKQSSGEMGDYNPESIMHYQYVITLLLCASMQCTQLRKVSCAYQIVILSSLPVYLLIFEFGGQCSHFEVCFDFLACDSMYSTLLCLAPN